MAILCVHSDIEQNECMSVGTHSKQPQLSTCSQATSIHAYTKDSSSMKHDIMYHECVVLAKIVQNKTLGGGLAGRDWQEGVGGRVGGRGLVGGDWRKGIGGRGLVGGGWWEGIGGRGLGGEWNDECTQQLGKFCKVD